MVNGVYGTTGLNISAFASTLTERKQENAIYDDHEDCNGYSLFYTQDKGSHFKRTLILIKMHCEV